MPAGNIEKLKYGIKYGADAVYLGVVDFSLRAMRKGELITLENLKTAIDTAHEMNAKAYLTLNIFAFNNDIKALENAIEELEKAQEVCKEQNDLLNNVMEDYTKLLNSYERLIYENWKN